MKHSQHHLYIHSPEPVFKARVNLAGAITYPINTLPYDGVTLGAYTDIHPYQTLLLGTAEGLDDLGRTRVKYLADATNIPLPRTARGIEDGTIDVMDGAYITVLDDWRVWAKIPYFDLGEGEDIDLGNDFKDSNIPAGDNNTNISPVANTGPGFAGYINPDTNVITVQFPKGGVNLSFAMADGATISTYNWDVKDGTITVGASTDAVITATFPAGFRWVNLNIVDSNGKPHSAWCPVLAVDPDDDTTLETFQVSQSLEAKGQTLDIQLQSPLSRTTYPDGTLVMFWWGEASDPSDRSHMKFIGWMDNENASVMRKKEGVDKNTTIHCIDAAGRLNLLPGFPQALEREESDSLWSWMPSLDMNKSLHYLLFWHSTALEVVDFILPADGDDYDAMRLDAGGATLFQQVDSQAQKMVPDHYLTCNSQGQLVVRRDWMLDDVGDRPIIAPIITESYWSDLTFDYNRHPKIHVLRSGAVVSSTDWVEIEGEDSLPLAFSIAPGDTAAWSQGTIEATENEGLTLSQEDLNIAEGHRYALLNSRYGTFSFKDASRSQFWDYEPAELPRVQLNIGALYSGYRDLDTDQIVGQVKTINVNYTASKEGARVQVSVTLKKEEDGAPALTFTPETGEVTPVPYTPPPIWQLPEFGDPEIFYDDMQGYVLWDGTRVFRTEDLQAASPLWRIISNGVDGNIYDCQYMVIDEGTIGAWLMTSTAIWFCADIQANIPTWTEVLTIETVQAADAVPPSGSVGFTGMTHYWSAPGHLCVTTSPIFSFAGGLAYPHAYFWITEDYGQNWTQVDMNGFLFTSGANVAGFCHAHLHGMASHRSQPTIYCLRSTPQFSLNSQDQVFVSHDMGYTWEEGAIIQAGTRNNDFLASILNPFPNADDPSYMTQGNITAPNLPALKVSTDGWDTVSVLADPTGYDGFSNLWRVNKRTFDNLHVLGWARLTATTHFHLLESNDGGATWSLLYNGGTGVANISDNPYGTAVGCAQWNTPNGWPPDVDQWVMIKADSSGAFTNRIQLTLDNFATLLDRTGNLAAVAVSWNEGPANGFALPKIGGVPDPATDPVMRPKWAIWNETLDTWELLGSSVSGEISSLSTVVGPTPGAQVLDQTLIFAPPPNTKRVRISVDWSMANVMEGTATAISQYNTTSPASISFSNETGVNVYIESAEGGWSGNYTADCTFANWSTQDWPINNVTIDSLTPTIKPGGLGFQAYASVHAPFSDTSSSSQVDIEVTILEIELDDGTIYTPV
jgi:hypothetical protein